MHKLLSLSLSLLLVPLMVTACATSPDNGTRAVHQDPPPTPVDCAALFAHHLKTDLSMSYQAFDQTQDSGMRVLAEHGCNREAADLIERYIETNNSTQSSLTWHIAQLRASAGDYKNAVRNARRTLRDDEDFTKNALRWNDYVLATIAFLERDKEALILHRDQVAQGLDAHFGNKLNLRLLDSLLRNFDRDYKYASEHVEAL